MKNILLVHGAWGGAWEFQEFIPSLEEQGHRAYAVDLPGHGQNSASITEVTLEAYVDQVIETAEAIEGPIILVGHSLAGAIISQVGERIPEKIERLVYVAASLPKNGESVMDLMQSDPEGQLLPNLKFSEDKSYATVDEEVVKSVMLHDVNEPERVAILAPRFDMKQATEPFLAPVVLTYEAFGSIPKSYVRATQDKVMSPVLQDRMLKSWEVDQVFTLESGHFPMMSIPNLFLGIINQIANSSLVPVA